MMGRYSDDRESNNNYSAARKNANRPKSSPNSSNVGTNQGKKSTIPVVNNEKKKHDQKERRNKVEPWKGISQTCLQTTKMATYRRYRNDDNDSDDHSDEGCASMIAKTSKEMRAAPRFVQKSAIQKWRPKSSQNSSNVGTNQGKKSMIPVVSRGNTTVDQKKRKKADPYDLEENEKDRRQSHKRAKEASVPVKRSVQSKSVEAEDRTRSFLCRKKPNTNDTCNNDDQPSSPNDESITSHEKEIKASPTSRYSRSREERLNNAMNEVRKVVTDLNKKFRNIQQLLVAESSEGSDFEMVDVMSEDKVEEEIEIAPGWRVSSVVAVQAAAASSMSKRLNSLMLALWDKNEREKLIIKKRKGDDNDERREVTSGEIKKLMRGCLSLQNMRILPVDGVDNSSNLIALISKKLKNDRYYNNRGKKGESSRREVSDADEGDNEDGNEDNGEEDNDDRDNDNRDNDDKDDDDNDNDEKDDDDKDNDDKDNDDRDDADDDDDNDDNDYDNDNDAQITNI